MTSKTDATERKLAGSSLPGIVVEPEWLEERIGLADVRPIDLREEDAYALGHIPGATRLALQRLGTTQGPCDNVLLPPPAFAELMHELGIDGGHTVVAYDDQWGLAAARLVWALHRYGHARTCILEGGWDRWEEEGREVTSSSEPGRGGRFDPVPNPDVSADIDWLAGRVAAGDIAIVDTRTTSEFEQGHIPGATSWDWFSAVPAGSWDSTRPLDELREEWGALGILPSREVVVYCRSGMRAAHTYMALKRAGYPRVRLYDGSWQEWSARNLGGDR